MKKYLNAELMLSLFFYWYADFNPGYVKDNGSGVIQYIRE